MDGRASLSCVGFADAQFHFEFSGGDFFGGGGGGGGGGGDKGLQSTDLDDDSDLYELLGIDEDADAKAIKRAYRKMSLKYHPDRNPGDEEAAKKFRELTAAYEILGDDEKKVLYDHGGMQAVKDGAGGLQQGGGGGFGGLFGNLFGGGGGGRGGNRGKTVQMETSISLEDFYNGKTAQVTIERRIVCKGCRGKKGKKKAKCKECGRCPNEVKMVQRQMAPGFVVQQQEEVPSKDKCKQEATKLDLVIERGAPDGTQLTFKHMADQTPGKVPGDIIIALKEQRHPIFERRGESLHMTQKITLKEALLGFSKKVTHLDGHEVELKRSQVTQPFQTVSIRNEGMPVHETPSMFGDLHVTYEIVFPSTLSAAQIATLKETL